MRKRGKRRWLWLGLTGVAILILADLAYLWSLWPNWEALSKGPIPKSQFIKDYEAERSADRKLPPLRWRPVAMSSIPKHVPRAMVVAEDSRFYVHEGIDWEAITEAAQHNWEKGEVKLGGSTISQQTAKNLFLSNARTPLRKWHELVLTWALERNLSKHRIISLYLNLAEFGEGIYGVEAAAQYYWKIGAAHLTAEQAAELAAALPSPKKHNPATRTKRFTRRREKVIGHLMRFGAQTEAQQVN